MSLNSIITINRESLTGFWKLYHITTDKKTFFESKEKCAAAVVDLAGYAECGGREVIIRSLCEILEGADREIITPASFDDFILEFMDLILEKI